jgi:hypothetical protein
MKHRFLSDGEKMIRMVRPTIDELKERNHGHWDWEGDERIYITECTQLPNVFIGVGRSVHESISDYWKVIDTRYDEVLTNNIACYDLIDG